MIKAEKKTLKLSAEKPQYITVNDITYAQVDSWFGHCRRDLKLDIIYPETKDGKIYPCILWICGGAWLMMDKSAHNLYLSRLAGSGFVVASVEYRTSNQGPYPMPLQDVKAAIRYLKAHADRFRINKEKMGVDNVEFIKGFIEDIPLDDETVNAIISNCVINLTEDKTKALSEAYRVLKTGGRLAIADVVSLRPVSPEIKKQAQLWAGCISGAIPIEDYKLILKNTLQTHLRLPGKSW